MVLEELEEVQWRSHTCLVRNKVVLKSVTSTEKKKYDKYLRRQVNNFVKTKDYLRAVWSCFARIEPTKRRSLVIVARGYHKASRPGDLCSSSSGGWMINGG